MLNKLPLSIILFLQNKSILHPNYYLNNNNNNFPEDNRKRLEEKLRGNSLSILPWYKETIKKFKKNFMR